MTKKNQFDKGLKHYEKSLDSSIKFSSKSQFPFTLFGFAITSSVLVSYILFAVTPMAQQAKSMAPPIMAGMCQAIETSPVFSALQHAADQGTNAVNKGMDTAKTMAHNADQAVDGAVHKATSAVRHGLGSVPVPGSKSVGESVGDDLEDSLSSHPSAEHAVKHGMDSAIKSSGVTKIKGMRYKNGHLQFDVVTFFNETICVPLIQWVTKQVNNGVDSAIQRVKDLDQTPSAQTPAPSSRRLSHHEILNRRNWSQLEPTIFSWWKAEAGEPAVKLALANLALDELQREAKRLFVSSPRAVHRAFLEHGPQVALEMALLHFNERQLKN